MIQIQKFYDEKTFYKYNSAVGSIHQKAMGFVKKNSIVLDVGCAQGYIGRELSKRGSKVYGIEASHRMASQSKKYYEDVVAENIEKVDFPWKDGFFDVILLLDILEHLFEPGKTLKKLKRLIKANGIVVISLPNIAHWEVRWNLLRGIFEYASDGLLDTGHIRFFTYDSGVKIIQSAGYEIVKTDLVIKLPKFISKLENRFPGLSISPIAQNRFKKLFGYQFIFVAKARK